MKIAYATDFHGNRTAIKAFFDLAAKRQVDVVIIGADLTPKKVALKLAEYEQFESGDQESGEPKISGGEIIFLDDMKMVDSQSTYLGFLSQAKLLNERLDRQKVAEVAEDSGYIIHEVENAFYELGYMIEEQTVLEKLIRFFVHKDRGIDFSEDEIVCIEEIVVEWAKESERNMGEREKAAWRERARYLFADRLALYQWSDEDFLPSQYLLASVLYSKFMPEMSGFFKNTDKLLKELPHLVSNYFGSNMKKFRSKLQASRGYGELINLNYLASLAEHSSIVDLAKKARSWVQMAQGQGQFLETFFVPLVEAWRVEHPDVSVVAMFGNDDMQENLGILRQAEERGILYCLNNKVINLGDVSIYGYGHVANLPSEIAYRDWEKTEEEVFKELAELDAQARGKTRIAVVHNPPQGVLDLMHYGNNAGSQSVLAFVNEHQPDLFLTGHIHEAPRLANSIEALLGSTLCVNPGGEHSGGLQAVIIEAVPTHIIEKI
jgi:Icc-related predicted phosphoesterase